MITNNIVWFVIRNSETTQNSKYRLNCQIMQTKVQRAHSEKQIVPNITSLEHLNIRKSHLQINARKYILQFIPKSLKLNVEDVEWND